MVAKCARKGYRMNEASGWTDRLFGGLASPEEALGEAAQRTQWRLDRVLRRWGRVEDTRLQQWRESDDAQ